MMDYGQNARNDQFSGEHLEGTTRLAEEEARKNKYFGMFERGHEGFHENSSDRNKMGNRSQEPHGGYE